MKYLQGLKTRVHCHRARRLVAVNIPEKAFLMCDETGSLFTSSCAAFAYAFDDDTLSGIIKFLFA